MEEVRNDVLRIISDKLGIDDPESKGDAELLNDLGVDSLDFYDLIEGIEKTFDIKIEEELLPKLKTINAIVAAVERKTEEKKHRPSAAQH